MLLKVLLQSLTYKVRSAHSIYMSELHEIEPLSKKSCKCLKFHETKFDADKSKKVLDLRAPFSYFGINEQVQR